MADAYDFFNPPPEDTDPDYSYYYTPGYGEFAERGGRDYGYEQTGEPSYWLYSEEDTSGWNPYTPYGEDDDDDASARTASSRPRTTSSYQMKPTGSVTTQTVVPPAGPSPTMPDIPAFEAPEWDKRAIAALTQQKMAPQVRKLRRAVREVMARPYENPNVKAMTLGQVLAGYGTGLQSAQAGAESAALAQYSRQYAYEMTAAQQTYAARQQARMAEFNAAWNNYLRQYTTTQTTQYTYGTYPTGEFEYEGEEAETPEYSWAYGTEM